MVMYLQGIGVLGPGLLDWNYAVKMFKDPMQYSPAICPEPTPAMLPPNELRRSSDMVRWSLHVAQAAMTHAQMLPQDLCTVFASSEGEAQVLQDIFLSLAPEEPLLSPTMFHHSGHNAAAGYWSIATQSQQSSTSLSCYDASFCGGLLELSAQVCSMKTPGLLVACDIPPPVPLYAARKMVAPFAVALLFTHHMTPHTHATLEVTLHTDSHHKPSWMLTSEFETLRQGNPAARALPLLAMLAGEQQGHVSLPYLNSQVMHITVTPQAHSLVGSSNGL